jgi:organic radical activating enzyme
MRCRYCFNTQEIRDTKTPIDVALVKKILDQQAPSVIVLGGGEPFHQKNFIPLAQEISKRHKLVIVTNLSHDVSDFVRAIDPEGVQGISASLHYTERHDLDKFFRNARELLDKKFSFVVTQVITPEVLNRYEEIQKRCSDIGATLLPKALEGIYRGKNYPRDYTHGERTRILQLALLAPKALVHVLRTQAILMKSINGPMCFLGTPCTAGYQDIVITEV